MDRTCASVYLDFVSALLFSWPRVLTYFQKSSFCTDQNNLSYSCLPDTSSQKILTYVVSTDSKDCLEIVVLRDEGYGDEFLEKCFDEDPH